MLDDDDLLRIIDETRDALAKRVTCDFPSWDLEYGRRVAKAARNAGATPIDMLLFCPRCHVQHIDGPEVEFGDADDNDPAAVWDNPPHRSHLCHHCKFVWRPADVPTNGVAAIKTSGVNDSSPNEIAQPPAADQDNTIKYPDVILTGAQLVEALEFIAPDRATDPDQLESTVAFAYGEGHAGKAMYVWCAEYPEEGSFVCDGSSVKPAPESSTADQGDDLKATSGPLLELDVLLAKYHATVWNAASGEENGTAPVAYDEAGVAEAKAIQRHVRAMLSASEGAAEDSIPADCDVRKILLRVVPGDGDGHEVYAKNVGEVGALLSELGQRVEDFELAAPANTVNATELAKRLSGRPHPADPVIDQAATLIEQQAEELAAFHLQCEHGISVEYDGSYVTAWKDDIEETMECAEGDRATATRLAIEAVVTGSEKG